MLEKPIHPNEYARQYREWEFDQAILEQILTCVCGSCAVCCIIRPFAIKAKFPDELTEPEPESPTDIMYDEIPYNEEDEDADD